MKKSIHFTIGLGFFFVGVNATTPAQPTASSTVCVQNQSQAVIWVTIPPHSRTLLTNLVPPYVASVSGSSKKIPINIACCLDSSQQICLNNVYCYTPEFIQTVTLRPRQMLYVQSLPSASTSAGSKKYFNYRIVDDGCSVMENPS